MAFAAETKEGQLLAAQSDKVAALRIRGRATFKISGEFRDFGLAAVRRNSDAFVLDFSKCASLDSTILGVIAMIGLEGRGKTAMIAVNASPAVLKQLKGVGLGKLLRFTDSDTEQMDWSELCAAAAGSVETEDLADTVLEAHETLMNLDRRNIPVFRDVVDLLKEQTAASENDT